MNKATEGAAAARTPLETPAAAALRVTGFTLMWDGEHYSVSKPGIDTTEVVPLSVVLPILDAALADSRRLDWLDEQREPQSYDGGETLHCYAWGVYGQTHDVRLAIDAAMKLEAADNG